MTIRSFETHTPEIDATAFVDDTALVIGRVHIGAHSSIWPMAVLRGDIHDIRIGAYCSVQDGTIVHVTHKGPFSPEGFSTEVGDRVTVGHRVILHGCQIGSDCLIGMDACLMDGVRVESDVIIGAGSLVTPGTVCESGYLWLGRPARKVRVLTDRERAHIAYSADYYAKLKDRHR